MIETLTAILVVITAVYAWITYRIMRANERTVLSVYEQTQALNRPYVVVAAFTVPDSSMFYLRVANTGRTAAHDLRLTLDRDFFQYGQKDSNLRDLTAFRERIDQLPPGSEIIFGLASAVQVFAQAADSAVTPTVFEIQAEYEYGGTQLVEKTIIDLRPYFMSIDKPDRLLDKLDDIRKELEKIAKKH